MWLRTVSGTAATEQAKSLAQQSRDRRVRRLDEAESDDSGFDGNGFATFEQLPVLVPVLSLRLAFLDGGDSGTGQVG